MINERQLNSVRNRSESETSISWVVRLSASPVDEDWRRLIDFYAPIIVRWSEKAGVASADCDDLVEDILIVVIRRVNEFRRRHTGAFRGWLRAIFVNQLRKYFRDHAKHTCLFGLDDACDPNSGLSHFFDQEHDHYMAHRAMQLAEKDFSETTWAAFHQQIVENISAHQVAAGLWISINAVLKAKSRVLKRIRSELAHL